MLPEEDVDNFGNRGYFNLSENFRMSVLANGDRLEELIEKVDLPYEYFEVIKITREPKKDPYYITLYRKYPLDLDER